MIKNKETINDNYAIIMIEDDADEGFYCGHFDTFKDATKHFEKSKKYWIADALYSNNGNKPRLLLIKYKSIHIEKIKVLKSLNLKKLKKD